MVEAEQPEGAQLGAGLAGAVDRDRVGGGCRPSSGAGEACDQVDSGDLLTELYYDLRRMAAGKMAHEQAAHTLQPTALVHEAWVKLGDQKFENKAHFFGSAAEAMRRILVERARRRGRQKRGGGVEHADYEESQIVAPMEDDRLLEVHEALDRFAAEDPLKAKVVKLRFFAGMQHAEIAALLSISEKTVRRHWQVAKIRLFQLVSGSR